MMPKKSLIRDLSCRDSPTDQLQPIFFQFFPVFAFDHEVKLLGKSFMELSCQTFRYVFSSRLIDWQQYEMSAST